MNIKDKIFYTKAPSLSDLRSNFNGFHPGNSVLREGYIYVEGAKPLDCDILFCRDVAITLRDEVTLRADIFRPLTKKKIPAILNSSIFGKNGSYLTYDLIAKMAGHPNRCGVSREMTTGLEMFEAIDPGFWCNHEYAVVNLDVRGVGMSEGNAHYFGTQDAKDNYDVIEWLAGQEWCNGKISMSGNSWLGITQWFTAAQKPPHLACIAPWEGHGNMYVDEYMRGGIPHQSVVRRNMCYGNNYMEDLPAAMRAYPLINDYWLDKTALFEKVEVPAYVVASFTSAVHTHGTFEGFRKINSKEKWLRVHNTQEWSDLYEYENNMDLLKFFDHYLKGIDNGWEKTPVVRLSVLNPGGKDVVGRPEERFPLARQKFKKLYLDSKTKTMSEGPFSNVDHASYISDDAKDVLSYVHTFQEEAEITGYIKLHLWVESESYIDMDIYARLSKLDSSGKRVFHDAILHPYTGPNAMLRVSMRELDDEESTESEPVYTFKRPQLLNKGDIVPVEMGFWPTSLHFDVGDKLELNICGFDYLSQFKPEDCVSDNDNYGRHIIHTGEKYDSYLLIPTIPTVN